MGSIRSLSGYYRFDSKQHLAFPDVLAVLLPWSVAFRVQDLLPRSTADREARVGFFSLASFSPVFFCYNYLLGFCYTLTSIFDITGIQN